MIDQTVGKIESSIRDSKTLPPERRAELLALVGTLKSEIATLSETDAAQARSIAGFTEVSTHEATRDQRNPRLVELSLEGLRSSVTGFEKSHPKLVQIVNAISHQLSNLGI